MFLFYLLMFVFFSYVNFQESLVRAWILYKFTYVVVLSSVHNMFLLSMFRVVMSNCCSYYAWFIVMMKNGSCARFTVIYYCCTCEAKKRDKTQMTRKTPTEKKMVIENVNTPCKERKRTPGIKESKMTPTKGRLKFLTTQGKKMYTNILRGTKVGWGYFCCARPNTYEDLDMWMMKTWGSSQPKTRRGFHITQLKKDYVT